jgi:SAM-dependent MidA family methyltransferase
MRRRGLVCDGPATQAEFLGALGAAERASHLMAANPARAAQIEGAVARLMAPGGMGTRFHAVGVRSGGIAPLPGFGEVDSRPPAP